LSKKIKLFDPVINIAEEKAVIKVLRSRFWASGSGIGNVEKFEKKQIAKLTSKKNIPTFRAGDTLRVTIKIAEGERSRLQVYEGLCIARKNNSINSKFTVRKISHGEGVERVFPLFSPIIDKIEVIKKGDVKRAKLYYLRDKKGKSARIAEKIKKKIGIDISEQVSENQPQEQEKIKTTENEQKETKLAVEPKKEEPKKETSKITTKNEELKKKKK